MKELPILFSAPMIRALLANKKTCTRRIINPQPIHDEESGYVFTGNHSKMYDIHNWKEKFYLDNCRYGNVGDLLYVRETGYYHKEEKKWFYKATDPLTDNISLGYKWKSSIHLRKEGSRIWLLNLGVKIERLQDIPKSQAIEEGIIKLSGEVLGNALYMNYLSDEPFSDPRQSYRSLWESINGPASWEANPWVYSVQTMVLSTTGKTGITKEHEDLCKKLKATLK